MCVLGHLSRLRLVAVAGCVWTAGCARPAPVAPVALTTANAPAPALPAATPLPPLVLQDVGWQLQSGDASSWADAPLALHTFSVGRWECALGEVLSDDALGASELEVRRTRRLACTHATGATVQTQLTCTLRAARAADVDARARGHAASEAEGVARELVLQLDTTPPLHLRCAASEVRELALISRDKREIAKLCVDPGGIRECSASAAPARAVPVRANEEPKRALSPRTNEEPSVTPTTPGER